MSPWITKGLLKRINKKNKLYKQYIHSPTNGNLQKFKTYKNRFKHANTQIKENVPTCIYKIWKKKPKKKQQTNKQTKNKTKQNKTKTNKQTNKKKNETKQTKPNQNKTKQNKTKQNKTKQNKTKTKQN